MNKKKLHRPDITLIGTGALGCAVTKALYDLHYTVKSVYNRNPRKAGSFAGIVRADHSGTFPATHDELGKLIIITVPDDALPVVSKSLSAISDDWHDTVVIHCSGVHHSGVLIDLKLKGAGTAAFHPIQTFQQGQMAGSVFKGITIDIEGDPEVCSFLEKLAVELDANPTKISSADKIILHLAAVLVCNYQVTLAAMATDLLRSAGGDQPTLKDLEPLMQRTLDNIARDGIDNSLSGPLKRGDAETVKKHLEVLKDQPDMIRIYKLLGRYTLEHLVRPDEEDGTFRTLKQLLDDTDFNNE